MILVLAGRFDDAAGRLVGEWNAEHVRLVTCEALAGPGWSWRLDQPADATIGIDGAAVPVNSLTRILCLLPGVDRAELPRIAPDEQEYVAGELMACLLGWLDAQGSLVLNPPSTLCLTGPHLHPEQWLEHAARVGLRVASMHRASQRYAGPPAAGDLGVTRTDVSVAVVAGRVVGSVPRRLAASAAIIEQLAESTGAGLLTALFARGPDGELEFTGAAPTVDLGRRDVAAALARELGATP